MARRPPCHLRHGPAEGRFRRRRKPQEAPGPDPLGKSEPGASCAPMLCVSVVDLLRLNANTNDSQAEESGKDVARQAEAAQLPAIVEHLRRPSRGAQGQEERIQVF